MTVLALIGKPRLHQPAYRPSDWHERDNFETEERARDYASMMSRRFSGTPYRIVAKRSRFVVQFIPEWRLRG